MLIVIFICIYLTLYLVRVMLMKSYIENFHTSGVTSEEVEKRFSVIQPIVSGDVELERCLRTNVDNSKYVDFIWVVDADDLEAQAIVRRIKKSYNREIHSVIAGDIPDHMNEKVYKQELALPHSREYFIAMDDDCIIDFDGLDDVKSMIDVKNAVVTRLPYYRHGKDFLTNMVVGFVNSNTMLTYLVLAKLNTVTNLNGMCYMAKKSLFVEEEIYELVEEKLSDEYEIAAVLRDKGTKIIQSTRTCQVGTNISGLKHYFTLMKRWMVFVKVYMSKEITTGALFTIVFPTALPLMIVVLAFLGGLVEIAIALTTLTLISVINYVIRRRYLDIEEPLSIIFYELVSGIIQPIHYLISLIRPREVLWRKNYVTLLDNGTVRYRKSKGRETINDER